MKIKEYGRLINIVHPRTMTMIIVAIISFLSLFIFFSFYDSISKTAATFVEVWPGLAIGSLIFLWMIWSEFTHKVSWDEEAIYFRPQCEPWEVKNRPIAKMKFDDITSINCKIPDKARYRPNMKMRILGVSDPIGQYEDCAEIKIDNFKRSSFEEFMIFLKKKRPDIF
ncbi:MAG: hypothetical protein ACT6Q5_04270 [Sphingopyxis solisilvae]|uniref:hypothetical protein n=1 Tax=Sphingopyxis solisilvae TaxID=1886788 RepID=UPI0040366491